MSNENEENLPNKRPNRPEESEVQEPEKRAKQTQTSDSEEEKVQDNEERNIMIRTIEIESSSDNSESLDAEIENYLQFRKRDQGLRSPSYSGDSDEELVDELPMENAEASEEELHANNT
ncbi:unnamed protein product [Blepharisma stoltei]|uniref:Uncharacterized protein n=1 Tax=Blepharisma stoltei TaxID=1481888 RepID=A0AAU9JYN9_9CILI|nr:unnamed protein product [Blepharisma stoltei]